MFTHDELAEIGTALYGSKWRYKLARQLGVAWATIDRWLNHPGYPVPRHRLGDIAKTLEDTAADLRMEERLIALRAAGIETLATMVRARQAQAYAPLAGDPAADAAAAASADPRVAALAIQARQAGDLWTKHRGVYYLAMRWSIARAGRRGWVLRGSPADGEPEVAAAHTVGELMRIAAERDADTAPPNPEGDMP